MSTRDQDSIPISTDAADLEARIAAIWCEVLEVEHVASEDNFVRLGGDSIGAVVCLQEVQQQLGRRLSLAEFLDPSMTLRAFTHAVAMARDERRLHHNRQ